VFSVIIDHDLYSVVLLKLLSSNILDEKKRTVIKPRYYYKLVLVIILNFLIKRLDEIKLLTETNLYLYYILISALVLIEI